MPITSISRDWGVSPSIVRIETSDDLATITTVGYLEEQATVIKELNSGAFNWLATDIVAASYSDGHGFFNLEDDFTTLVPLSSGGGSVILPTTAGAIATYIDANGTLSEGADPSTNEGEIRSVNPDTSAYLAISGARPEIGDETPRYTLILPQGTYIWAQPITVELPNMGNEQLDPISQQLVQPGLLGNISESIGEVNQYTYRPLVSYNYQNGLTYNMATINAAIGISANVIVASSALDSIPVSGGFTNDQCNISLQPVVLNTLGSSEQSLAIINSEWIDQSYNLYINPPNPGGSQEASLLVSNQQYSDPNANIFTVETNIDFTQLATAGTPVLFEFAPFVGYPNGLYRVLDIFLYADGWATGDRNIVIEADSQNYASIASADIISGGNSRWGDSILSLGTAASFSTVEGTGNLVMTYDGGTTDYDAGTVRVTLLLEKIGIV